MFWTKMILTFVVVSFWFGLDLWLGIGTSWAMFGHDLATALVGIAVWEIATL